MKGGKIIFIGYIDESKGFFFLNPKTNKLVILIDVIFNELAAWQWEENVQKSKNLEVHVFLDFQDKSNSFPSMSFEEAPRATSSPLDLQALPCQI